MTTDNRTNGQLSGNTGQFTEAQVEAAAKALHETRNPWIGAYGDWGAAGYEIKQAFRESARAALEAASRAAQGAAPQAETDRALEIAHELAKVHTFTMADGEAIARAALSLAVRALPSSGVDEDAAIQLVQDLARDAYEAYEDSSDNAYGAWSWLTERHEQMRAGRVLAGKEKNDD